MTEFIDGMPLQDVRIEPSIKRAIIKGYIQMQYELLRTAGVELDSNIATDLIYNPKTREVVHVDPMAHKPSYITVEQIIDDGLIALPNDPSLMKLKAMKLKSLIELHGQIALL